MKYLSFEVKDWGKIDSKIESRRVTIIDSYRSIFGRNLSINQQYWTLCGRMVSDKYEIQKGCELDQVVQSGLIKSRQFYGIEGNYDIHIANKLAVEKTQYHEANFYHGEFIEILDQQLKDPNFNPGIVYLDTIQGPKGAGVLLARTLNILNYVNCSTMLVWNFLCEHRTHQYEWEFVANYLNQNGLYTLSIHNGKWKQFKKNIVFKDNRKAKGNNTTVMGTVVFYKR